MLTLCISTLALFGAALAHSTDVPTMQVEIYRIAPGQHVAFLKLIALYDQANEAAGLPPRQLYVHQDGADWDFLIIQPNEDWTEQQRAKVKAALTRLGAPQGAQFFIEIRKLMAEHTDTVASGPTTAADWLKRLN
jgi:hypothetical protein